MDLVAAYHSAPLSAVTSHQRGKTPDEQNLALFRQALALVQAVVDAQPAKSKTKGGKAKGTSKRFVEKVMMTSTMGKSFTIRRMSLNLRKSVEEEE